MQIIVDFGLSVQQYLELVMTEGVRALMIPTWCLECPFCEDGHYLRKHGSYGRHVVTEILVGTLLVRRLLCAATGRTISLLPHFLAPRKEHTWDVIGAYLHARETLGWTEVAAMEAATQINPSRQKGEYWTRRVECNLTTIQSYLSGIRPRVVSAPSPSALLKALGQGFTTLAEALAFHNAHMRERMGVWLL